MALEPSRVWDMGWQEVALLHTWGPDPCCSPQRIVVCHPVLVAHITLVANDLHPLGVLVHHLPCRGGPLLAQSSHVQVLVLHCQPLCLEACGGKNGMRGAHSACGHQTVPHTPNSTPQSLVLGTVSPLQPAGPLAGIALSWPGSEVTGKGHPTPAS